jgi:endoglucanase
MNYFKLIRLSAFAMLGFCNLVPAQLSTIPAGTVLNPGNVGPVGVVNVEKLYSQDFLQMYRDPLSQLSTIQGEEGPSYNRAEYSVISSQPIAHWFSAWNPGDIRSEVATYVGDAASQGQVPVMVIYNIYKRDCGSASAGGAEPTDDPGSNKNEDAALKNYRKYITNFTKGIQDGLKYSTNPYLPVMILLEPDSLGLQSVATIDGVAQKGSSDCADFSPEYQESPGKKSPVVFSNSKRNETLRWAVNKLASAACDSGSSCASYASRVKVYLDATHSGWGGWESVANGWLIDALIEAGIQDAAGIFSNVSNYQILGDPTSTSQRTGELPYGKWILGQVKKKLDGSWGTYTCGSKTCRIPEKRQVIDVARTGAERNLSSSNDQGNGWSGWCDNIEARVGQTPTLHGDVASWVDALLWVKPAGETDGCFGNGKTNHNIARGVPNPDAKGAVRAGTFSYDLSCMLLFGSNGFDSNGNPILNDCEPIQDLNAKFAKPRGLRITSVRSNSIFKNIPNGFVLEWNPSPGACQYQVVSRVGTSGSFYNVVKTTGDRFNGPATTAVITSDMKNWRTGETVQYAVRARGCGDEPVWSNLSSRVTTHDFP